MLAPLLQRHFPESSFRIGLAYARTLKMDPHVHTLEEKMHLARQCRIEGKVETLEVLAHKHMKHFAEKSRKEGTADPSE